MFDCLRPPNWKNPRDSKGSIGLRIVIVGKDTGILLYGNLTLGICFSMFVLCCWGSFSEVPHKTWLLQFGLCDMAGQFCAQARVAGAGL